MDEEATLAMMTEAADLLDEAVKALDVIAEGHPKDYTDNHLLAERTLTKLRGTP